MQRDVLYNLEVWTYNLQILVKEIFRRKTTQQGSWLKKENLPSCLVFSRHAISLKISFVYFNDRLFSWSLLGNHQFIVKLDFRAVMKSYFLACI